MAILTDARCAVLVINKSNVRTETPFAARRPLYVRTDLHSIREFLKSPSCRNLLLSSLYLSPDTSNSYRMRSLTLTRAQSTLVAENGGGKIGALAVDPEKGVLYVATERKGDMGVEVEVIALTPGPDGGYMREVSSRTEILRRQLVADMSRP